MKALNYFERKRRQWHFWWTQNTNRMQTPLLENILILLPSLSLQKVIFLTWKVREKKEGGMRRGREAQGLIELPSDSSRPQVPATLADTRCQNLIWVFSLGSGGSTTWSSTRCFPECSLTESGNENSFEPRYSTSNASLNLGHSWM